MILFIKEVKKNKDKAILKYNILFDKNYRKKFQLTKKEIREAYKKVDYKDIIILKRAAKNIKRFAKIQLKQFKCINFKANYGSIGQKIIPIEKVGCYVPGGNYPLPSTALMTIIPAKVAGVKEVIVCSPKIKPITIVAADISGANKIFNVGGVQAIAAMAYGTKQIPKVDKIVGPGNKYVAEAKKLVFGEVGIDFIAGPSEVLIIADKTGNSKFIAADILAQAEHDIDARAQLITTSYKIARETRKQLKNQIKNISTSNIAEVSLRKNGKIIVVKNIQRAIQLANKIAPEHLELQIKNPNKIIKNLKNYGSLFIGNYSAEVLGDYCSGTNHSLPTGRASRYSGGLSVKEFIKILTYQRINKDRARKLYKIASALAKLEGLEAHKNAAEIRFEKETLINKENLIKSLKEAK